MPAFFIICVVVIVDQLSKFVILNNFLANESRQIVKDIFHLSLVFNQGFAFGLFANLSSVIWTVIYLLAVGTIIFIFCFSKKLFPQSNYIKIPLALIVGGALGNSIDRIRFGYVVDFLDFRIWPVFNLADSAITIGTCLLILQILKKNRSKN